MSMVLGASTIGPNMLRICSDDYLKMHYVIDQKNWSVSMDLKDFYFQNIQKDEYHYRFYDSIENGKLQVQVSHPDKPVSACCN